MSSYYGYLVNIARKNQLIVFAFEYIVK